jgi:pyrroline-5-carboxylate reductase
VLWRCGFATAEEVEATPEHCLLELSGAGPMFLAAVADALAQVGTAGSDTRAQL